LDRLTYGGKVDVDATVEIMKLAYDHGINFFDTAEVYAGPSKRVF
jgi:aryl-alcohol dehydrogenase-like predicted oxidoreductase